MTHKMTAQEKEERKRLRERNKQILKHNKENPPDEIDLLIELERLEKDRDYAVEESHIGFRSYAGLTGFDCYCCGAPNDRVGDYCSKCIQEYKFKTGKWEPRHKKIGERIVRHILQTLLQSPFPSTWMEMDDQLLEIDCFGSIPTEKGHRLIAVEVQGIHHYKATKYRGITQKEAEKKLSEQKWRDTKKKEWCQAHGITFLEIDNTKNDRTFAERIDLVKKALREANIDFDDSIEVSEQYD